LLGGSRTFTRNETGSGQWPDSSAKFVASEPHEKKGDMKGYESVVTSV